MTDTERAYILDAALRWIQLVEAVIDRAEGTSIDAYVQSHGTDEERAEFKRLERALGRTP